VLLGVEGNNLLLQVGLGGGQLSKQVQSSAQEAVGPQEERGVLGTLGQSEELFRQLLRCMVLRPLEI
jgi:hypothetical protein